MITIQIEEWMNQAVSPHILRHVFILAEVSSKKMSSSKCKDPYSIPAFRFWMKKDHNVKTAL